MTEFGYPRASDQVLAVRSELADQVVLALRTAGLPAFREDGPDGPDGPDGSDGAGAVVMVDADAETGSAAVSVGWRCGPGVAQAALDALVAGSPGDAPAVRRPGTIALHMQGALIGLLLSAGFLATPEHDLMNPDLVLVFGRTSDLPPALRPAFVPPGSP
ncbi:MULTISPECIES: hypothetical protein [unclassified Streptomyces]|uniref:hypothetical protein n=1 Tax=unclassified Streptomyces TaxID=2593676 RepID=UPI002E2CC5AD|nr:hypothetical protein [Streptomyces sp. NBC_01439]